MSPAGSAQAESSHASAGSEYRRTEERKVEVSHMTAVLAMMSASAIPSPDQASYLSVSQASKPTGESLKPAAKVSACRLCAVT